MKTIFVGNLSPDTNDEELRQLFSTYGKVRGVKMSMDVFSGRCRGFATIDMEGHEARAAIAGLNGKTFKDKPLKVNEEKPRFKRGGHGRR